MNIAKINNQIKMAEVGKPQRRIRRERTTEPTTIPTPAPVPEKVPEPAKR